MSIEVFVIIGLLTIPAFLVSRIFLKKRLANQKDLNLWAVLGALFIAPTVYVLAALVFFLIFFTECERSRSFNRELWFAEPEGRYEMQEDIIDSKMLIGLDKVLLTKQLGEPNWAKSDSVWEFDMGMSSAGGFGVVYHTLLVRFKGDTVANVEYVRITD